MQRILLSLGLLLLVSIMAASPGLQITTEAGQCIVQLSESREGTTEFFSETTLALPATEADLVIGSMSVRRENSRGEIVSYDTTIQPERIELVSQFTMRELHGFTVKIENKRQAGAFTDILESAEFALIPRNTVAIPTSVSGAFLPAYREMVDNFESSYLRDLPVRQSHILIVTHSGLNNEMTPFITWKRMLGFQVSTVYKSDIGTSATAIRDYVANFYNTDPNPPDYLILIGESNGMYGIPTFYFTTDVPNAADLRYGCVSGDDYLPEILVGRISVDGNNHLSAINLKTIRYERRPYMDNTDWMTSALVVAGNAASEPPIPVTPVLMSRWLVDKFFQYGFTRVDTVYYPGTFPGYTEIQASIEAGKQFVSYRGWGAAEGWHYPLFHIDHLEDVESGEMMPIVTSVVCNTGDFDNANQRRCFGEYWMSMGSDSEPNGCVAFMGPSDLHTSTEFNNAISTGFYNAVFRHGVRSFGTAVLMGKTNLMQNYPNNAEAGGSVDLYFNVYNTLCDPTLNMWFGIPNLMEFSVPMAIPQGQNYIEFFNPFEKITVTTTRDNVNFNRVVAGYGNVIVPVDTQSPGNVTITVSQLNFKPWQYTIAVSESDGIGVSAHQFSTLEAGQDAQLTVTTKNYGTAPVTLTAVASTTSPYCSIDNPQIDLGTIAADGTTQSVIDLTLTETCPDGEVIPIILTYSDNTVAKMTGVAGSLNVMATVTSISTGHGYITPGETANVTVTLSNLNGIDVTGLTANVASSTTACTVVNPDITIGALAPNGTAQAVVQVQAVADACPGRVAGFRMTLTDDAGRQSVTNFSVELGPVTQTHPTGPDNYGYYCYDSNDTAWSQIAPTYQWHTIDPNEGGNGTLIPMRDDVVHRVALPFTFRFYGRDYDEIYACSNGWISFGYTHAVDFRNWNIPSVLGPDAMVAAYWDDLKGPLTTDSYEDIRFVYYHDTTNGYLVLQWNNALNNEDNESVERFEMVLIPRTGQDGDIVINYHDVNNPDANGNYCTVGIDDDLADTGLCYSYANIYPLSASPLQPGLSIKFTTDAPDNTVGTDPAETPALRLSLDQNYPNPFNPETNIRFALPNDSDVRLEIYNVRGQKVKTLLNENRRTGTHTVTWKGTDDNGAGVASGIYLYRLTVNGNESVQRKMLLVK